jgi:hypothetical protein
MESTVTRLTRRSFLKQTSVSAATLGLLPAIPALAAIPHSPEAAAPELSTTFTGPMVVHVSDVTTGEVTLLAGAREIVFRDPQLVARLIKATR